jgi:hypothetical protein
VVEKEEGKCKTDWSSEKIAWCCVSSITPSRRWNTQLAREDGWRAATTFILPKEVNVQIHCLCWGWRVRV